MRCRSSCTHLLGPGLRYPASPPKNSSFRKSFLLPRNAKKTCNKLLSFFQCIGTVFTISWCHRDVVLDNKLSPRTLICPKIRGHLSQHIKRLSAINAVSIRWRVVRFIDSFVCNNSRSYFFQYKLKKLPVGVTHTHRQMFSCTLLLNP